MDIIKKYFPEISKEQESHFSRLKDLYAEWNAKINVISRKDIDELYERHVLHSLSIAMIFHFKPGSIILDIGTGGGFPGIPLAIFFPEVDFLLVDSIGKKIKVVDEVANALGLKNVRAKQLRAEQVDEKFDFIVTRAVADLQELNSWVKGKFLKENRHDVKNGLICLKGGELNKEINPFGKRVKVYNISDFFEEEFFQTKKIVYLSMG